MAPVEIFRMLLVVLLVACAIGAVLSKKTLTGVIIFMSYSGFMAIVWALLRSPDLAITEAAVGAGVSTVLFFICLRRLGNTEKKEGDGADGPRSATKQGKAADAPKRAGRRERVGRKSDNTSERTSNNTSDRTSDKNGEDRRGCGRGSSGREGRDR